ncbi:MAG: hypothetical protein K0Q76_942 [Panacagrimonas sp.]|jgi:hypothetical protein|nr:SRPBCC family protein [Panacagrimonas sp.]MCC2655834.1 hypothetical protein [Panacagrimonas sp.]
MAYSVLVERTVKLPPQKVYARLADFGGISKLLPDDIERLTMRNGEGIGSIRVVRLKGTPDDLEERLEALVPNRLMSYSLTKNTVLPLEQYHAVVELAEAAGGGTTIRWGSNWVPKGAPEAEIKPLLSGLYNKIIDSIEKQG